MPIKIICSAVIIICSFVIGSKKADDLRSKLRCLQTLKALLGRIRSGVCCGGRSLRTLFEGLSIDGEFSDFFLFTLDNMNNEKPLEQIWRSYKAEPCFEDVFSALADSAGILEGSDIEAISTALGGVIDVCDEKAKQLSHEYSGKIKTYPTVGIVCGVFLSALIW